MTTASIIICTRNRADSLHPTLQSIGRLALPQDWRVDLSVVDNGSSDHTASVVREARLSNVKLQHIIEPKPGQSQARNAGLVASSGDIVLFTDDDIRVPENWVTAMCDPILNGKADAVVGGVKFPAQYNEMLLRSGFASRRGWLASTEELDGAHPARMVGANMAFHRRVLSRVPAFDTELGPGALGFCDDTLFGWQIMEAGYKLAGALDVEVEHHFDLTRLDGESLVSSARKMGRSHAFVFYHWKHQKSRMALPRLMLYSLRRRFLQLVSGGADSAARHIPNKLVDLEQHLAFCREYLVQRRRRFKYAFRGLVPEISEMSA